MNNTKQRIAIATACGWIKETDGWWDGTRRTAGTRRSERHLPDYLNDLNAMHVAERVLNEPIYMQKHACNNYIEILRDVIGRHHGEWARLHATAPQRAEAFLRTLNLWVEEA